MTKQEYQKKLIKIFKSMIRQQVFHYTLGLGIIEGVENNKCIVRYIKSKETKEIFINDFLDYHYSIDKFDEINELKCEYELSLNKKDVINEENKSLNKITFDDVIGLDNVKELVNQMIIYPFKYKNIYQTFRRKSGGGILLYGAPGTGKTMIVKAIANEIDAKLFSIKCSDIASKWYGESERKIKDLFQKAESYDKSIIFFDEFDSLGAKRENNIQSINMVVSELLAQIDGFENKNNTILLIASTNKPWNIDSALLRSGRFNKKIYISLPNEISRYHLLLHEMKNVPSSNIDYQQIAIDTDGFSGADIVELCNSTKDIAIKNSISSNNIVPITQNDFIKSLSFVHSTVVKSELDMLARFSLKNYNC